jgi:hypothetical protein
MAWHLARASCSGRGGVGQTQGVWIWVKSQGGAWNTGGICSLWECLNGEQSASLHERMIATRAAVPAGCVAVWVTAKQAHDTVAAEGVHDSFGGAVHSRGAT